MRSIESFPGTEKKKENGLSPAGSASVRDRNMSHNFEREKNSVVAKKAPLATLFPRLLLHEHQFISTCVLARSRRRGGLRPPRENHMNI